MLKAKPITLKDANAVVMKLHRHHNPVRGCRFCIAAVNGSNEVVGVCIAGRPVSRRIDDGYTLEVSRVATDGTKNACSFLLARAAKAAKAIGYRRIITYTLDSEQGASLRGAGWLHTHTTCGGSWSRDGRIRAHDLFPPCAKQRWERVF